MLINAVPSGASPECLQFLTECLKFSPDERPDAAALRTHDWLKDVQLPQARACARLRCACGWADASAVRFKVPPNPYTPNAHAEQSLKELQDIEALVAAKRQP